MKQLKKLTWDLKKKLDSMGKNVSNWAIKEEKAHSYILVNKKTGDEMELNKIK